MSTFSLNITENFKSLIRFFKGTDFSKALLIGIAITTPIVLGILFDQIEIGLALCFGAFWSSPSDVGGSFKHNTIGILASIGLVMLVSFIGGYLRFDAYVLVPFIGLLSFAIAFISVYGFRASLISFSGLLALVLSFAHDAQSLAVYEYTLLIGAGGLWYLLLSTILYLIKPKAQVDELLAKTFSQTADFLTLRGNLIIPVKDRKSQLVNSFNLQSALIELHTDLRAILINSRKTSGKSLYKGKRLLVFVQLVEMLETAIANPVNYDKMDELFKKHPEFMVYFQDLIIEMANQLAIISQIGRSNKKLPDNKKLIACFDKANADIASFGDKLAEEEYELFLMLKNYIEYQELQFKKLRKIKWLLGNPEIGQNELIEVDVFKRFVVPPHFDPKLFWTSLSFRSNIFKHSLRLAVTLMIGYTLGTLFAFQNPYWILLTIIVIMRPSYGLTKSRSKDRVIGTLIGSIIAVGIVLTIQNTYVFATLALVTLIIAFAMVQKNYKASAVFITLSVIFIYGIIQPDILRVIQFRILDTVLGAGLSFLALLWLWPAWSFREIKNDIKKSVVANRNYFNEITTFYKQKGAIPTSLKLARKDAFVETSNLSAAFQRMAQEPRSKQKNIDKIYQMVEMNHVFLSSLASLSSYFQQHPTTEASLLFVKIAKQIDDNLDVLLKRLDEKPQMPSTSTSRPNIKNEEFDLFFNPKNIANKRDFQEAHLISGQLHWLYSLSENMCELSFENDAEE
ncbi:FUSC family protein [Crocinitomix catalasitica]|uniref:FUSC family protein n=1 Tax=Crocinitomix catalasitica TaxID=184607 RepID=UPI000484C11F|nr:FUSC family membrane protein [Crocinitomix catalasitica]